MSKTATPVMSQFERDLLESIRQAKAGEHARVTTPEQIAARKRGRPVGTFQAVTKKSVTMRLDSDLADALRASGDGWQTRVNDMIRASMALMKSR